MLMNLTESTSIASPQCELVLVCDRMSGYESAGNELFARIIGDIFRRILESPGVEIPFESTGALPVVPHRLPRDRFPRRSEVLLHRIELGDQIVRAHPHIVVALGELAAYALFDDRPFEPGEWRTWRRGEFECPTYYTLHPREALWNHANEARFLADSRSKKRRLWDDWRAIAERLNEQRSRVTASDTEGDIA